VAIALLRIHCFESFESTICFLGVETYDNDNDTRDSRICVLYQRKSAFFFLDFPEEKPVLYNGFTCGKVLPYYWLFQKSIGLTGNKWPRVSHWPTLAVRRVDRISRYSASALPLYFSLCIRLHFHRDLPVNNSESDLKKLDMNDRDPHMLRWLMIRIDQNNLIHFSIRPKFSLFSNQQNEFLSRSPEGARRPKIVDESGKTLRQCHIIVNSHLSKLASDPFKSITYLSGPCDRPDTFFLPLPLRANTHLFPFPERIFIVPVLQFSDTSM